MSGKYAILEGNLVKLEGHSDLLARACLQGNKHFLQACISSLRYIFKVCVYLC